MVLNKEEILERDNYCCQKCGKPGNIYSLQMAHRIKQGSGTVKTIQNYIRNNYNVYLTKVQTLKIIHDEKNVVIACDKCNDYFNIFFKEVQRDKLISKIYEKEFKND